MKKRSNGEGTICKRNDGRWMGQLVLDGEDGKYKRKTVYGKTQKEVKEKMEQIKADCRQGKVIETSDMTLEQWMEIWIKDYKPDLKITTRENYECYIDIYIKGSELGKIPLNKLKTSHLQRFYNEKLTGKSKGKKEGLSPTTVRYLNIIIKSAIKQAVNNRMINENVCNAVVLPKKKKVEIVPFTQDDITKFLKEAQKDRLYALYLLEMMTGLRRGEILGLKWENIDFEDKRIEVVNNLCKVNNTEEGADTKYKLVLMETKTETSHRVIPMNDSMIEELKAHKIRQEEEKKQFAECYHDLGMVFCKQDGNYIYPREFLTQYQRLLKRAGLEKKRFHDLRHTVASFLINANENPKVIQQLLGHSNISTTLDIYAHVMGDTMNKSVDKLYEQLRLDSE